ncbi:hypothetical protein SAP269_06650 [Spiroplasma ixodetis]|uniref:DDE Tnp4 domain-containing protein n=1 Tax=Spiroplasma ixodetis TaxID=2141 RepID=A0ABM8JLC9_9MOLU
MVIWDIKEYKIFIKILYYTIKKTKNKKLNKKEKIYNKIISKIRIKIEHVFAWLKRFKILINKCRKSIFRLMYLRFNLLCEIFNKTKPLK